VPNPVTLEYGVYVSTDPDAFVDVCELRIRFNPLEAVFSITPDTETLSSALLAEVEGDVITYVGGIPSPPYTPVTGDFRLATLEAIYVSAEPILTIIDEPPVLLSRCYLVGLEVPVTFSVVPFPNGVPTSTITPTPTETPALTDTETPTETPTRVPTWTLTQTGTPGPSPTPADTNTPDPTATISVQNGLVSYWDFNEGSGTVLHDSVSGYDGVVVGGEWIHHVNGALSFDGIDDQVVIEDAPGLSPQASANGEMSLSFWLYVNDTTTTYADIIVKGKSGLQGWEYGIVLQPSTVRFAMWTLSGYVYMVPIDNPFPLQEWHHYVYTAAVGQDANLYVDGVLAASSVPFDITRVVGDGPAQLFFGGSSLQHFFGGAIDEVRLYNRMLTQSEIDELYALR
jgi:hypothetical protein